MRIFDQHSTCGGEIIISRIEELLYLIHQYMIKLVSYF